MSNVEVLFINEFILKTRPGWSLDSCSSVGSDFKVFVCYARGVQGPRNRAASGMSADMFIFEIYSESSGSSI